MLVVSTDEFNKQFNFAFWGVVFSWCFVGFDVTGCPDGRPAAPWKMERVRNGVRSKESGEMAGMLLILHFSFFIMQQEPLGRRASCVCALPSVFARRCVIDFRVRCGRCPAVSINALNWNLSRARSFVSFLDIRPVPKVNTGLLRSTWSLFFSARHCRLWI